MKKILPFILFILSISGAIELEMISPLLPSISSHFKVSDEISSLIITVNLIGFIIGSLFIGSLSEKYGRRKMVFSSNLIFVLSSIGCAYSPNILSLIVCRLFQGIGCSGLIVMIPIIIADYYNAAQAEKFYKITGSVLTIFTGIAPLIGGFIGDNIRFNNLEGWSIVFLVITIVELIAFTISLLFLEETKKDEFKDFNVKLLIISFYKMLRNKNFIMGVFVLNMIWSIYLAIITFAPFLYINFYKITISEYSLHLGIFIATYSVLSFTTKSLKMKKYILFAASFLNIFSFFLMFFFFNKYLTTFFLSIFAITISLLVPFFTVYCMNIFNEDKGSASSFIISTRNIMVGISISFIGLIYKENLYTFSLAFFILSAILSSGILVFLFSNKGNNNYFENFK